MSFESAADLATCIEEIDMKTGMMRVTGCMMILALVSLTARADAPDRSTPMKAAVAFAKAIMAGDMEAVKSLSTGTEAEYAMAKTVSDMAVSMKKLGDASVKKFGDAGKLPKEMQIDLVADFEASEVKIDGDKAALILKSKPDDKFPPTLKKDGDNWKMDLSNLSKDPSTAQMMPMVPKMVKCFDAVTKNIGDDKYKTAMEALTDLGEQLNKELAPPPAK